MLALLYGLDASDDLLDDTGDFVHGMLLFVMVL